jgi:hypothetical protein
MAEPARKHERTPEDEGIPDFDEDLRRRRLVNADEGMAVPGERPAAARDRVTPAEQRERESMGTRAAREIPDEEPDGTEPRVGRIYDELSGWIDTTKELVADETDDVAGMTAEEAAMRALEEQEEDEEL